MERTTMNVVTETSEGHEPGQSQEGECESEHDEGEEPSETQEDEHESRQENTEHVSSSGRKGKMASAKER